MNIKNLSSGLYELIINSFRLLPDFLIIGSQKGGTTSLYLYLTQHPLVCPAIKNREIIKEIHFFDTNFNLGLNWYKSHFPTLLYKFYKKQIQSKNIVTGESTPYYIFHPLAAKRISETLPNIKLIILLRNPIDRAFSHYQHQVKLGNEKLSFEEAIDQETSRLDGELEQMIHDPNYNSFNYQKFSYLARGIYINQIKNWMYFFPKTQFLILSSEELYQEPSKIFNTTLDFLNLPRQELKEYKQYNANSYTPLTPETRCRLREYFRPYNEELYEFLDLEFDWD